MQPISPLSGVRISWLIFAMNLKLCSNLFNSSSYVRKIQIWNFLALQPVIVSVLICLFELLYFLAKKKHIQTDRARCSTAAFSTAWFVRDYLIKVIYRATYSLLLLKCVLIQFMGSQNYGIILNLSIFNMIPMPKSTLFQPALLYS